jgi:prepilin-type processing-associated H-X9-DG protein
LSTLQRSRGWSGRCRSLSGDICLGAGNIASGPIGPIYKQCIKVADLQIPGPTETWAFLDEHPDSMNDPAFFPPRDTTGTVDTPAAYHNKACGFSFCDGHAEIHKWKGCLTGVRASAVLYVDLAGIPTTTSSDPDIYWLSYHSPRLSGPAGTPY